MGFDVLQIPFKNLAILLIIIFILIPTLVSPATAPPPTSQNFPIAKPNCVDRCGNIRIPFPFGTKPDCFKSPSFWVTCKETIKSPKLFSADTDLEINDISADGQMKIMQYIARSCYANGTVDSSITAQLNLTNEQFTVNTTANKLTIVGCDTYGLIFGRRLQGGNYATGCIAMCKGKEDLVPGSCQGVGCCQIPIPEDAWRMEIGLGSFLNYSHVSDSYNCSYGFFAEETAFKFSPQSLTGLKNVSMLPIVIDWVIGNGTCGVAQLNSTNYACKSLNSECYEPEKKGGYRCRCNNGYQGNPYLEHGCQDIDECAAPDILSKCKHVCENTDGDFKCSCPKGYRGDHADVRGDNTCSREQRESFTLKLVTG